MPRLSKWCTMVCLALSVFVWTIFAAYYLTAYGLIRRFELENKELIDFRVIVLTFSRSASLIKALRSIDAMELDGDKAVLEIWIDRAKSGLVDNRTVQVAQSFNWTRGPTRVHIQKSHAGICGQWIDSWRPTSDKELAVIVEDDVSLSKYAYRWIKAVHGFYGERKDFGGSTLTSDEVRSHHVSPVVLLKAPKNETVFMYSGVGSWGFSPKQAVWNRFQVWYHTHVKDTNFHPYVDGIRPTQWYKAMEKSGTSNSVWTQWFIYFTNMEKLLTIYNNLPTYVGDRNSCLSINRREVGLHTRRKGREDLCRLLDRWDERFVQFSENITKFDWAGKKVGQIDSHGTKTSEPIKAKSSVINKLDGVGKKVGQIDSHGTKSSEPIKAKSSDFNNLDGAGKKVGQIDSHGTKSSEPIKAKSSDFNNLDGAGKKVGQIDSHGTKSSEPIKAKSSDFNNLDGAGKKVGQIDSHGTKSSEPIKAKSVSLTSWTGQERKLAK